MRMIKKQLVGENGHSEAMPSMTLPREEIHLAILKRVERIAHEFIEAFEFIKNFPKSVSIFGSARFTETNEHYRHARELARRIASELDYAIVSGGGGGIMEAANRGAMDAKKESVGLNITLPNKQTLNSYTTQAITLHYFFVRKTALSFAADAYIFFPGGYGTLDEFFELITLIQTKKIRRVPIILVGFEYWKKFDAFIRETLLREHHTIDDTDVGLYEIAESDDQVLEIIKKHARV